MLLRLTMEVNHVKVIGEVDKSSYNGIMGATA